MPETHRDHAREAHPGHGDVHQEIGGDHHGDLQHQPHGGAHAAGHEGHHAEMVADFRRRFWVSLVLTAPVALLSPMIQGLLGVEEAWGFPGDRWVQLALASAIFFYGGWPFLWGLVDELRRRQPGMMTLIGLAIGVAYGYSAVVTFGVTGEVFFWELASLIDIMLLGHWIEMRSILGASGALEALVKLMPAEAHRIEDGGAVRDIPVTELSAGDRVLVKPGEKVPVDGLIVEGRTSLNEAMLTGESRPVEKGEGDGVIAARAVFC